MVANSNVKLIGKEVLLLINYSELNGGGLGDRRKFKAEDCGSTAWEI